MEGRFSKIISGIWGEKSKEPPKRKKYQTPPAGPPGKPSRDAINRQRADQRRARERREARGGSVAVEDPPTVRIGGKKKTSETGHGSNGSADSAAAARGKAGEPERQPSPAELEREADKLAAEITDSAIEEAVRSVPAAAGGERLRFVDPQFREDLKQKVKNTNVFGGMSCLQAVRDFAVGAGAAIGLKMSVGMAVSSYIRRAVNIGAPGVGAIAGGVAGGFVEGGMALGREIRRTRKEKKSIRTELEGLHGLDRVKRALKLHDQDTRQLLESDPYAAELLRKMEASKVDFNKVGRAAFQGAIIGAIGGAAFTFLFEHTHIFDAVKHLFQGHHAAPTHAPPLNHAPHVVPHPDQASHVVPTAGHGGGAPHVAPGHAPTAGHALQHHAAGGHEWGVHPQSPPDVQYTHPITADTVHPMDQHIWHTAKAYLENHGVTHPSQDLVNQATRKLAEANGVQIMADGGKHIAGKIADTAMAQGFQIHHFEALNNLITQAGGTPEMVTETIKVGLPTVPGFEHLPAAGFPPQLTPETAGLVAADAKNMETIIKALAAAALGGIAVSAGVIYAKERRDRNRTPVFATGGDGAAAQPLRREAGSGRIQTLGLKGAAEAAAKVAAADAEANNLVVGEFMEQSAAARRNWDGAINTAEAAFANSGVSLSGCARFVEQAHLRQREFENTFNRFHSRVPTGAFNRLSKETDEQYKKLVERTANLDRQLEVIKNPGDRPTTPQALRERLDSFIVQLEQSIVQAEQAVASQAADPEHIRQHIAEADRLAGEIGILVNPLPRQRHPRIPVNLYAQESERTKDKRAELAKRLKAVKQQVARPPEPPPAPPSPEKPEKNEAIENQYVARVEEALNNWEAAISVAELAAVRPDATISQMKPLIVAADKQRSCNKIISPPNRNPKISAQVYEKVKSDTAARFSQLQQRFLRIKEYCDRLPATPPPPKPEAGAPPVKPRAEAPEKNKKLEKFKNELDATLGLLEQALDAAEALLPTAPDRSRQILEDPGEAFMLGSARLIETVSKYKATLSADEIKEGTDSFKARFFKIQFRKEELLRSLDASVGDSEPAEVVPEPIVSPDEPVVEPVVVEPVAPAPPEPAPTPDAVPPSEPAPAAASEVNKKVEAFRTELTAALGVLEAAVSSARAMLDKGDLKQCGFMIDNRTGSVFVAVENFNRTTKKHHGLLSRRKYEVVTGSLNPQLLKVKSEWKKLCADFDRLEAEARSTAPDSTPPPTAAKPKVEAGPAKKEKLDIDKAFRNIDGLIDDLIFDLRNVAAQDALVNAWPLWQNFIQPGATTKEATDLYADLCGPLLDKLTRKGAGEVVQRIWDKITPKRPAEVPPSKTDDVASRVDLHAGSGSEAEASDISPASVAVEATVAEVDDGGADDDEAPTVEAPVVAAPAAVTEGVVFPDAWVKRGSGREKKDKGKGKDKKPSEPKGQIVKKPEPKKDVGLGESLLAEEAQQKGIADGQQEIWVSLMKSPDQGGVLWEAVSSASINTEQALDLQRVLSRVPDFTNVPDTQPLVNIFRMIDDARQSGPIQKLRKQLIELAPVMQQARDLAKLSPTGEIKVQSI